MLKKSEFKAIVNTATDLESVFRDEIYKSNHKEKDVWEYIPCHYMEELYEILRICEENKATRGFLDVGAGTGRIVFIVKECKIFDKVCGAEFHPPYVNLGRKIFRLSKEELLVGNGFELLRDFLWKYSLVYTYMPIRDKEGMGKLHQQLFSRLDYDSYLAEMYPVYYPTDVLAESDKNLLKTNSLLLKRRWGSSFPH